MTETQEHEIRELQNQVNLLKGLNEEKNSEIKKLKESLAERVKTANEIIIQKNDELKNLKSSIQEYADQLKRGPTWPIAESLASMIGVKLNYD